jgi:hypothetical protein
MDDLNGFLVNAALVGALVPVLTAIGTMLKALPVFRAVPEYLPLVNVGLGIAIAVGYTLARAQSGGAPATSVELVLAVLAGVMAGQLSARVYDAAYTGLAKDKGPVRAARIMRATPKRG